MVLFLGACAAGGHGADIAGSAAPGRSGDAVFARDRSAILAMAGDFRVSFEFIETVAFVPGYNLKEPKRSGGHEIVRVIEDRGDFISLQHLLVVGPSEAPMLLACEVDINSYRRDSDFPVAAAERYWAATADYWAGIRAEWDRIAAPHQRFSIAIAGETEALYRPLLELAGTVAAGNMPLADALAEARAVMARYVRTDDEVGPLAERLRAADPGR